MNKTKFSDQTKRQVEALLEDIAVSHGSAGFFKTGDVAANRGVSAEWAVNRALYHALHSDPPAAPVSIPFDLEKAKAGAKFYHQFAPGSKPEPVSFMGVRANGHVAFETGRPLLDSAPPAELRMCPPATKILYGNVYKSDGGYSTSAYYDLLDLAIKHRDSSGCFGIDYVGLATVTVPA